MVTIRTTGEEQTAALGARLAPVLEPGDIVLLSGPVGAGKSVLARAIIQTAQGEAGLPVEGVPSPSFTLVQTYNVGGHDIWHCDLYRLGDPGELVELGISDAGGAAILLIEWPDLAREELGPRHVEIAIAPDAADADARRLDISFHGSGWERVRNAIV